MAKAIETGIPKMKIEEAAAKKQAKIDSEQDIIVGINRYQSNESYDIDILDVDNSKVRNSQIRNLDKIKSTRNNDRATNH